MLEAAGGDPRFNVRGFECLGACDIAPMASVNGEYVGPLTTDDCKTIVGELLEGREVLPGQAAAQAPARRHAAAGGAGIVKLFFEDIDRPGLNTLKVYEQAGGYKSLRKALKMEPEDVLDRAPGLRRARARRRRLRDGQEGLLPAQGHDGQVPRLQRRRVRARAPSRTAS